MELTNEQKQALKTIQAAGLELPDELLDAVAGGANEPTPFAVPGEGRPIVATGPTEQAQADTDPTAEQLRSALQTVADLTQQMSQPLVEQVTKLTQDLVEKNKVKAYNSHFK